MRKKDRKKRWDFRNSTGILGGIESQGKGALHIHLVIFLAIFSRDSEKLLELMCKDDSFQSPLISFFRLVIF